MRKIRNLLFVLAATVTLTFTTDAQELQTDGIDFQKENLDNFNQSNELKSSLSLNLNSSSSLSTSSYNSGGNTMLGPGLMIGGLLFGTVGVLGGTFGADYEGSGNTLKPFYRQGAHFLTALSGAICLTTGFVITLSQ